MNLRDPLVAAGVIWCSEHRTETWPTDAAWLGEDLLMATFPDSCCLPGTTTTIVPSLLKPIVERCGGITMAGARCRNRPLRGGNLCYRHQHQHADRENA